MVDDIECYGLIESKEEMPDWDFDDVKYWMYRTATHDLPDVDDLPDTVGMLRLFNINLGGDYVDMFGVVITQPVRTPFVFIDQGLAVRKDLLCTGLLGSFEGQIWLWSRLDGSATRCPVILLNEPGYQKLDIRTSLNYASQDWGQLECGQITTHNKLEINTNGANNPVINLRYQGSDPRMIFGHDGTDAFLASTVGDLKLVTSQPGKKIDIQVNGQAGGQLRIQNTNSGGSIATIGVGDTGLFTNQFWLGNPYGTNSINDFAYGLKIGLYGQTNYLLGAMWANNIRLEVDVNGKLKLPVQGNNGGLLLGGDVHIYRSGANMLAIDDDFEPSTANTKYCGNGGNYWAGVVCETIYRHSESSFDALDDLALVKQYKTKIIEKNGVKQEVIDIESLPHLKADPTPKDPKLAGFWDESKVSGFLLGCVKQLTLKVEQLEAQIKEVKN